MSADREVLRTRLIEAMLGEYGQGNSIGEDVERMLDAALALCSPCQTCGGVGDFDGGYSLRGESPMGDEPRISELRDGRWVPACPEPLWVGWRLRIAQCECGEKFKDRTGEVYRRHWRSEHAAAPSPADPRGRHDYDR